MIRLILPLFFIFGVFLATQVPSSAQISVGVRVGIAPPPLPEYEQPDCPGDGYIWTPGFWDWDGNEYYWVPGTCRWSLRKWESSGLRDIGVGATADIISIRATGECP